MARPPPFDKGGKLQGGACGQPGNHDPRVIANPCRGRFYIGPVCGAANAPGGYLRPKSRTCGLWPPKRACGRSGIRPYMMGKCGGCFRGRHFVAGQSLRPRLAARPPPFDKGGKWRGGARSQPGKRGGAGFCGRDLRPKSRRCAAVGLRNAPAGAVNPAPTNKFYVLVRQGWPQPCVITSPCRGRCLHRPANLTPPQTPAGGPWPSPTKRGKCRDQPPAAIPNS